MTQNSEDRFKSANYAYKCKLAKDWGFDSPEEVAKKIGYKLHKRKKAVLFKEEHFIESKHEFKDSREPPLIHNVHILDSSYSMHGKKFNNALEGIKLEIENLKKSKDVEYFQTLAYFKKDTPYIEYKRIPISKAYIGCIDDYNNTPLYDTIKEVLYYLLSIYRSDEKILIKIFTDGENNYGRTRSHEINTLIQKCEKAGFTITFVGTLQDVQNVQYNLSIKDSNTLVHNNTADGIKKAFERTMCATEVYSKKVIAREDVSEGFYKELI